MTAESLISFALVFLVMSAVISLSLGLLLKLAGGRMRSLGARAEKRASALMLATPPALSSMVVGLLAVDSARSLANGMDHCLEHSHHLHICLVHGAEWATRPWAVALLAVVLCILLARGFQLVRVHTRAQRAAWRFRRLGDPVSGSSRVVLIPIETPTVFTAGALSPTVVISRGAWGRLGPGERRAVIMHELAHVAGGDIWRRALLALLACFSAPGLASHALRLWDRAAERICDRHAAGVVGPSIVAEAIVSLSRASLTAATDGQAPMGAVFAAACSVTERVHSLLDGEPDGGPGAARLSWGFFGAGVGLLSASALFSEQLHHLFETILG